LIKFDVCFVTLIFSIVRQNKKELSYDNYTYRILATLVL